MTEITEGLKDKVVIDILRRQAEKLRRENKAHLQVAINIQDTLTKSTAQYKAEIDRLKDLLAEVLPELNDYEASVFDDEQVSELLNLIGRVSEAAK